MFFCGNEHGLRKRIVYLADKRSVAKHTYIKRSSKNSSVAVYSPILDIILATKMNNPNQKKRVLSIYNSFIISRNSCLGHFKCLLKIDS